jgi:outer membrane translocation and assembly module TamA
VIYSRFTKSMTTFVRKGGWTLKDIKRGNPLHLATTFLQGGALSLRGIAYVYIYYTRT